ncbi:MAG: DUF2892 domain-containing protein [Solirubrobacteraceae bacterium]
MNKYIKPVISAVLILIGIYFIVEREYGWTVFLFFLAILPMVLYFRNENILLVFWQLRKQNLPGAKAWLLKIKNPTKELAKMQYGYYYYLNGLVNSNDNFIETEKYMKLALQHGLTFDHDKAMAKLTLASSLLSKGRKKEAEVLMDEAKKLDKAEMLKDQIKMMKDQMKKMQGGGNFQNPNMRKGGGGSRGKFF